MPEYAAISGLLGIDLGDSVTLANLSVRNGITQDTIAKLLPSELSTNLNSLELESAMADSLYSGYVAKQDVANQRVNKHDSLKVPSAYSFANISGLSNEMVERLERARPQTFGQVRNISGLTPAAISTVLVHLTAESSPTN
jgi:tRNA uridine 5-carboxymethylaminomethyl modification enzyme